MRDGGRHLNGMSGRFVLDVVVMWVVCLACSLFGWREVGGFGAGEEVWVCLFGAGEDGVDRKGCNGASGLAI